MIHTLVCSFLLFGWCCSVKASNGGSILSPEIAKTQMMQIITPRLEWAISNNNFAVQSFNAEWEPIPTETKALYKQARQVYLFAQSYKATADRRYLQATIASADFMLRYMFDEPSATWFASVNSTMPNQHYSSNEYDTSFALFAMAHAYEVTQNKRYLDAALSTWMLADLSTGFVLAKGKYNDNDLLTHDIKSWSTNSLMHLFEALIALYKVTDSDAIWQDIILITKFVGTDLLQEAGFIAEYYQSSFQPLSIVDGGYVELGHQVEWAYLLHTAVDLGLDIKFRRVATQLVEYALAIGWDASTGSLAARANYKQQVIDNKPVWWAQAELMRLFTYLSADTSNLYLFSKSYAFCINNYINQINGGWQAKIPLNKENKKQTKVLGYHAVAAYLEVIN